jgi:hypothetical protein
MTDATFRHVVVVCLVLMIVLLVGIGMTLDSILKVVIAR